MTAHLSDKDFDASRAGKKAANLHRLTQSGHKVPPGFVLYPDEALEALSDGALQQAVDRVGGFPVAVRSSGTLEDLAEASFAGQYETFLEVASLADLREKIEACRASGRTERVRVYLEKQGLRQEAAAVAVLVQRMVAARSAGVAFSIHPVTGKEEHFLIECVKGLGEKLVSGHVSPSRFVMHAESGQVLEKEQTDDGGTLSASELDQLREALLDVQAEFGAPQDVEWAVDDQGQLFLLQSRPVTKVQWRTDVEEFTNADFKDGGISARVCTPLMYSLYRDAVTESMQRYFEGLRLLRRGDQQTWIGFYYGRGYWNASAVKRALCKIPGFHEEKFDQDLGIQKDYGHSGPRVIPTTPKTLLGAIPVAVALEVSYRRQLGIAREYGHAFQRQRQAFLDCIARFQATEDSAFWMDLQAVFRDFHGKTEQAYFTTIYNNANAQSDFKSFLAKMDAALGRTTSMIHLMGGLSNVSHMDVQRGYVRLHRVAQEKGLDSEALSQALAAFLRVHGFHADAELDLTCPRWSEAPERVREHVATMVRSALPPADPDKTEALQRRLYQDEVDAIEQGISRLPLGSVRFLLSFRSHLGRVRGYLSAREKMREYSTQTYAVVRAYVVEAGRRFHARGTILRADDVFMLHTDEVLALAQGRENVEQTRRKIAYRRKMYDGYRDFLPPNELGRGVEVRGEESFEGKNVLQGLGCSPGVVEGTVCVVPTLEDVHRLRKGDILVTRFTDPGWTPVLGMVAAVVTEVGGLLSHAAVIGREYGIPAVLNLPGATRALKSGQRVRVDGSTGRVELLADATASSSSGASASARSGAAAEE